MNENLDPSKNNLSADELEIDKALRPLTFSDFNGQKQVIDNLKIFVQAANEREEALDHTLLHGPPGLGKTTLAHILAEELGVSLKVSSGPVIDKPGDLAGLLTSLENRDVLFIDEIHRLKLPVEEVLYSAMEDYKLDIVVGKGPEARTLRIDVQPFTLVGATTRAGLLSAPLRDRFGILANFEFYNENDLSNIIQRSARILGVSIEETAASELAGRSRGTPRITNRLLRRVRDVAQVRGEGTIGSKTTHDALAILNVNEQGLEKLDMKILSVLVETYEGAPVGLSTLAISVGENEETIAEVCEPFLIQLGFVERTPRGRRVTSHGRRYFKDWKSRQ